MIVLCCAIHASADASLNQWHDLDAHGLDNQLQLMCMQQHIWQNTVINLSNVCSLQVEMLLCVVWKKIFQVLCVYEEKILVHMFLLQLSLIQILTSIFRTVTSILSCMWT